MKRYRIRTDGRYGMTHDCFGEWVKYDDIKHLLTCRHVGETDCVNIRRLKEENNSLRRKLREKEPTFTLPQKKKTKKRWIDDQRYKSAPEERLGGCDGCDLIAKRVGNGACPYVLDCDKDHIIWKLSMTPQKKKTKKRWVDGQRYKSAPEERLGGCDGCTFDHDQDCPLMGCQERIWKLAMPKSKPLDLANLPKGFTPERWFVELCRHDDKWIPACFNESGNLENLKRDAQTHTEWQYRYTKKAPK